MDSKIPPWTSPACCCRSCQLQLLKYISTYSYSRMLALPLKIVASGYLAASFLLFCFPKLKHRVHPQPIFVESLENKKILVIGHRGSPREKIENTIESFERSLLVSDMLEMDVCMTKDGILVVHHDLDLKRTCDVARQIKEFDLKDLPKFKEEVEVHFAEEGRTTRSNGEKIPTLDQIFNRFPQVPMNIELKTPSQQAIAELVRLVSLHQRHEITIFGIRGKMQSQLRKTDPKINTFTSDSEIVKITLAYLTGWLPFMKIQANTLQIPLYTQNFHDWKRRQWGDNLKACLFFTFLKILNQIYRPLVWHLRKRGIMTFYWVCNTEQQMSRAITYGASGIITDQPFLLRSYLNKNPPK